ncbi:wiskott-Aldrich syndrome protein-like [Daphnia pulex]|uniref:wiskott-Aldrich syndrome protein-like n=1 Tax=Daphnia pulex TaxID=6669 RepID=UPI001EDEB0EF|nr:wiskott-Aldrich syndrome protein-like [Daphnia pulex]XP_046634132.1 wiskott-Aldrich syndrome protein-like [Daphnia pulicaria]
MGASKTFKSRRNCPSRLLSNEENTQLNEIIGAQCKSAATTVVQLFLPEPPEYTQWTKEDCGILCLIEDSNCNFWLKIFCLVRRQVIWQQKLHENVVYHAPAPYFHTVSSSNNTQIGLNFADEAEASIFLRTVRAYLLKNKANTKDDTFSVSPPKDFRLISHIGWDKRKGFILYNVDNQLIQTFLTGFCNRISNCTPKENNHQRSRPRSFKRKKISKNDISLPVDVNVIQRNSQL